MKTTGRSSSFVLVSVMSVATISCTEDSGDAAPNNQSDSTAGGGDNGESAADGDTTASDGSAGASDSDADADSGDGATNATGGDDGDADTGPEVDGLEQYTPDQAQWDTFASKPFEGGANTAHDPDGVSWMSAQDWAAAEWDGTVYNPSQMTPEAFVAAICPSVDRVRGIREVFYEHNPFADPQNPTKAEVDEWHRIAINHVRALVGYTSRDRLAHKDHCMFARALWGDERKFSTQWDDHYPGETGSAAGPCQGSSNAHCGASFIPSPDDQAPYLPDGHAACTAESGAEGVFSGPKSNIPWSIKWSRGFCNTLIAEGFWGGHVGPWFHRERFGLSFWDDAPDDNDNNAILRAKWSGTLMPSLYCNPTEPDCDPDTTGPQD